MSRERARQGVARAVIRDRWRPQVEPAELKVSPAAGDYYVVVDAIEAHRAVLVMSGWPDVDVRGHLVFVGEDVTRDVALDEWQQIVDRERAGTGQPAADRTLRVGDAFLVRIPDGDPATSPVDVWQIIDVTRAARRAAHAALVTAANPELRAEATTEPSDESGAAEPPPTGSAAPAV